MCAGVFGDLRVLGKQSTPPSCEYEECQGLEQQLCPVSPRFMCSSLVLEKNNANDWPAGTSFQLILNHLELRRGAGSFGSILISTISSSGGGTAHLLDTGEVPMHVRAGSLAVTHFQAAPVPLLTGKPIAITVSLDAEHEVLPDDGIMISLPPEFILPLGDVMVTHPSTGQMYAVETSRVPITYLKDGRLSEGSTGNVTIRPALMGSATSISFSLVGLRSIHVSGSTGSFYIAIVDADGLVIDEAEADGVYLEYEPPVISRLIAFNVPKRGEVSVTVHGNNFGYLEYNPGIDGLPVQRSITVGATSCSQTTWVAHSSLLCRVSAGFTFSTDVTAVIEGKQARKEGFLSYDVHELASVMPSSMQNLGSARRFITAAGIGFGIIDLTAGARVGGTSCEHSYWRSDSSLVCNSARSQGMSKGLVVSIQVSGNSVSTLMSYDKHDIVAGSTSNQPMRGSGQNQVAIVSVGIGTRGLGSQDMSGRVGMGGSGTEASRWQSDSGVECRFAFGGGSSLGLTVTSALGVRSLSGLVSYDALAVFYESSNVAQARIAFLHSVGAFSLVLRTGASCSARSLWVSQTSVTSLVLPPAVSRSLSLIVTAGASIASSSSVLSIDTVTVSSSSSNIVLKASLESSSIQGRVWLACSRIGARQHSQRVVVASTAAAASLWVSDSSLTALASPSGDTTRTASVRLTAGLASLGTLSNVCSHDAPTMSFGGSRHARNLQAMAHESSRIVVGGTGLGLSSSSSRARHGG